MTDKLNHRLSRIIGQLEGIKSRHTHDTEKECLKTIQQLKASINGLKKFGEAYVQAHMKDCLNDSNKSKAEMEKGLAEVISGAFSL